MTWLGDDKIKVTGDKQATLLRERSVLVASIEILGIKPLPNKTQSALIGRQEDLLNLAKKVKAIDKKLGRIVD